MVEITRGTQTVRQRRLAVETNFLEEAKLGRDEILYTTDLVEVYAATQTVRQRRLAAETFGRGNIW